MLDEILMMKQLGVEIELFSLWKENAKVVQPDAEALVAQAHFLPLFSWHIFLNNLRWIGKSPIKYFSTLMRVVWENKASSRFLFGALAVFPKVAAFAIKMKELDVDHIHAHFASHPAAAAYIAHSLTNISWSFTAHGSDLHREQSMLGVKVESAKFVAAISKYNRKFINERIADPHHHKVKVVHCGVNIEAFPTAKRLEGPVNIICIGTLHEVKGQRYLLEACANLRTDQWRLNLVGDGEDRKQLEALATELKIRDRVIFHGNCKREYIRDLLAEMHIACSPSVPTANGRREGIPVALMEAAACSLPLVGSNLSGIPEIITSASGILAEPRDAEDLTNALNSLVENAELRLSLGQGANRILREEFSLASTSSQLLKLFQQKESITC